MIEQIEILLMGVIIGLLLSDILYGNKRRKMEKELKELIDKLLEEENGLPIEEEDELL